MTLLDVEVRKAMIEEANSRLGSHESPCFAKRSQLCLSEWGTGCGRAITTA